MSARTVMAMVNPSASPPMTSDGQWTPRYTRETAMASEKSVAAAITGQRSGWARR